MEDQTKALSSASSESKLQRVISKAIALSWRQNPVKARFENPAIREMNPVEVRLALIKVIGDTLDYFGHKEHSFIELLVGDIIRDYQDWTLVDIIKAFAMGRAKTTELYGKLAGHHFRGWLVEYDRYLDEKIAEHRRNEKIAVQRDEIDIREAYRNWKLPEKNRSSSRQSLLNPARVFNPMTEDDLTRRELIKTWEEMPEPKVSLREFVEGKKTE